MGKRIVILGNGISCQLFLFCLRRHNIFRNDIVVLEKKENSVYKIDDVPFYFNEKIDELGDIFIPITVKMGIYENKIIYYEGKENLSRKYANKILGYDCRNTVSSLKKTKQAYVMRSFDGKEGRKMSLYNYLRGINDYCNYLYKWEVIRIDTINKVIYSSKNEEIKYDYLISTIPLNTLIDITNKFTWIKNSLQSVPFNIHRFLVDTNRQYKVLYCTDEKIRFSRMAKLNDTIYLETKNKIDMNELLPVEVDFLNEFLAGEKIIDYASYTVYPGRFKQISEESYRYISEEFGKNNLFLLGRMATWKFKLIENIYTDCEEICKWIC